MTSTITICFYCGKESYSSFSLESKSIFYGFSISQILEFVVGKEVPECSSRFICEECLNKLYKFCKFKSNILEADYYTRQLNKIMNLGDHQFEELHIENYNLLDDLLSFGDPQIPGKFYSPSHNNYCNEVKTIAAQPISVDSMPTKLPKQEIVKLVEFCTHCDRGFSSVASYNQHKKNYHHEFKCFYCDFVSVGKESLKLHVNKFHKEMNMEANNIFLA